MIEETTTADTTHELTAELIEGGPTLLDVCDIVVKAIAAGALVVIAGRLG